MLRLRLIIEVLNHLGVNEVDIGYTRGVLDVVPLLTFRWISAIHLSSNRAAFKFHDVLRQSASFITEDVVDHAKLFVQVRRLDHSSHVLGVIIDVYVPHDELSLREVDHFEGDEE